ncbi:MAG: hypothetical protein AB1634_09945 [Thermodesulfobacteriota bacterium]
MKEALAVIIQTGRLVFCHPERPEERERIAFGESHAGEELRRFCAREGISTDTVVLFVAESLLFFKTFELPAKTADLQEAIGYQLGILTPFDPEDLVFGHSAVKDKEVFQIALYAAARSTVAPVLEQLTAAGFTVAGLYPEYAQYLAGGKQPATSALVLEGPFPKAFLFKAGRLVNRLVLPMDLGYQELVSRLGTDLIAMPEAREGSGFGVAAALPVPRLGLREFNLLPADYRRPEYSRWLVAVLLALNLLGLAALAGIKEYRISSRTATVAQALADLRPQVEEVRQLKDQEEALKAFVSAFGQLGENPDIIAALAHLTESLPASSYLDQVRMEKTARTVNVTGFTRDMGELSKELKGLGDAKLKSTSRRRDKTYFDMDITLP